MEDHLDQASFEVDAPRQLQEFAPLSYILNRIPTKAQKGFSTIKIELISIDVTKEYIALGSNIGLIFLFDRKKETLQRLNCDAKNGSITSVKMLNSLDYMVAAGTSSGLVCVFQMPSILPGRVKQLQKYTVDSLHKSSVTSIAWSSNGMKIFTGDQDGVVVLTEMDYSKKQSQSSVIMKEGYEIVQLSYAHMALVVSTKLRSVIYKDSVGIQIGQKERKALGNFGASFTKCLCKPADAIIYAARPGLRLWKAKLDGSVDSTLMFKDSINQKRRALALLSSTLVVRSPSKAIESQFGPILIYGEDQVITWDISGIYILDPNTGSVLGAHDNIGFILDIATYEDEIFVLRTGANRCVIRIAQNPEKPPIFAPEYRHGLNASPSQRSSRSSSLSPVARQLDHLSHRGSPLAFIPTNIFGKISPSGQHSPLMTQSVAQPVAKEGQQSPGGGTRPTSHSVSGALGGDRRAMSSSAFRSIDSTEETPWTPRRASESSATTLPPIVRLESDDLLQIEITEAPVVIAPNTDDGREESNDIVAKDEKDFGKVDDKFAAVIKQEFEEDIVFQAAVRKPKKKKKAKEKESKGSAATSPAVNRKLETHELSQMTESTDSKEVLEPTESSSDQSAKVANDDKTDIPSKMDKEMKVEEKNEAEVDHPIPSHPDMSLPLKTDAENSRSEEVVPDLLSPLECKIVGGKVVMHKTNSITSECDQERRDSSHGRKESTGSMNRTESAGSPGSYGEQSSRGKLVHDASVDDIYTKYRHRSDSQGSVTEIDYVSEYQSQMSELSIGSTSATGVSHLLSDNWTEFTAPGNIQSLAVSSKHIWIVDKSERVFYSGHNQPSLNWKRDEDVYGVRQIAVSPDGNIVWKLKKNGSVFVGTKITPKTPMGLKSEEVLRDVAYIAVEDKSAWYIKNNGGIMMQKGLSKERPFFQSIKIDCHATLIEIVCCYGVVWGLTDEGRVLVRLGIDAYCPEGTNWVDIESPVCDTVLCCLAFGEENTAWALDIVGRMFFKTGVTMDNPMGEGNWWQVSLSEYIMQDATALDIFKALREILDPHYLASAIYGQKGGLVVSGMGGVGIWICPDFKNVIHVSRGVLIGHSWSLAAPAGLAPSMRWAHVCAQQVDGQQGLVWAQQPNGEIVYISVENKSCTTAAIPGLHIPLACCSVAKDAVWALCEDGKIYVRSGIATHCPWGFSWIELDLAQLADKQIVYVSAGMMNVWSVDSEGTIYLRIGVTAAENQVMNPVWVPVDGAPQSGAQFVKVFTGPEDRKVWAIDNKKTVYVRIGITDTMPLGTDWISVPGTSAEHMTISKDMVWALSPSGEVLARYGLTDQDCVGNYWKKIPGIFSQISASPHNDLWAITKEGQLYERTTGSFIPLRHQRLDSRLRTISAGSDVSEGDWELV
ncbi:tectonin beta-propeller repeat-containing protein 2-like [Lineus longissimus]|uniref:tectonin beta-propeller repeat-containing protein 2-like n=1 Tax=Lineus longissimus TaxID=88925 RepID=UPI002B4C6BF5